LSAEVVRKPPKPILEKLAQIWAGEWTKKGKAIARERLISPRGFRVLSRKGGRGADLLGLSRNRRMSKDYERVCTSAEVFICAAMIPLMVRRLERTCACLEERLRITV
jgi:hypothetical protein